MSQLRLGRREDGTRDIRILEPAVGRVTHTRYGIQGGSEYVVTGAMAVGASSTVHSRDRRTGTHRKIEPLLPATTPSRRAQMAAYKARKRGEA
ncbi:MAG: hypothetical protein H0W36_00560 [Gemmatimonadetes bacterium]|nr:hypothetical protein [Gemmatimonadota bacterium]